jgi:hypothetical protein
MDTNGRPGLTGTIRGVAVLVGHRADGSELQFQAAARFPVDLVIGQEGVGSAVAKLALGKDIEVGDSTFDRKILVRGPETAVVAALSAPLRETLLAAVEAGYRVKGRSVIMEGWPVSPGPKPIIATVKACVSLAEDLARAFATPVAEALARNAASDPVPAVRRRNLTVLLEQVPGEPATAALGEALQDPLADNRRFAAERILSWPVEIGLREAAQEALAQLSLAQAGQLSLSGPRAEGAVSIAGVPGAVSIADDPGKKD